MMSAAHSQMGTTFPSDPQFLNDSHFWCVTGEWHRLNGNDAIIIDQKRTQQVSNYIHFPEMMLVRSADRCHNSSITWWGICSQIFTIPFPWPDVGQICRQMPQLIYNLMGIGMEPNIYNPTSLNLHRSHITTDAITHLKPYGEGNAAKYLQSHSHERLFFQGPKWESHNKKTKLGCI